jgi:hypothetical protein
MRYAVGLHDDTVQGVVAEASRIAARATKNAWNEMDDKEAAKLRRPYFLSSASFKAFSMARFAA